MHMAARAWKEVKQTMIANCFQNTFWLKESETEHNEEEEDEFDALANVPVPAKMQEEEFHALDKEEIEVEKVLTGNGDEVEEEDSQSVRSRPEWAPRNAWPRHSRPWGFGEWHPPEPHENGIQVPVQCVSVIQA